MSSVWGMILQWGSTVKVSIELVVTTRHRRDMTEKLLKATLYLNKQQQQMSVISYKQDLAISCLCLLADPPRDDGGSEITKYIVELDDGKGRSNETLSALEYYMHMHQLMKE